MIGLVILTLCGQIQLQFVHDTFVSSFWCEAWLLIFFIWLLILTSIWFTSRLFILIAEFDVVGELLRAWRLPAWVQVLHALHVWAVIISLGHGLNEVVADAVLHLPILQVLLLCQVHALAQVIPIVRRRHRFIIRKVPIPQLRILILLSFQGATYLLVQKLLLEVDLRRVFVKYGLVCGCDRYLWKRLYRDAWILVRFSNLGWHVLRNCALCEEVG